MKDKLYNLTNMLRSSKALLEVFCADHKFQGDLETLSRGSVTSPNVIR